MLNLRWWFDKLVNLKENLVFGKLSVLRIVRRFYFSLRYLWKYSSFGGKMSSYVSFIISGGKLVEAFYDLLFIFLREDD